MSSTKLRRLTTSLAFAVAIVALTLTPADAATDAQPGASANDESQVAAPAETAAPAAEQFLAVLRPVERLRVESAWKKADEEATGRHFKRLQEAAAAGIVIFAGRTLEPLDMTMGLIVFEAADAAAAKAWAEADPAVVAGVMTVEVRPYQLAVTRQ